MADDTWKAIAAVVILLILAVVIHIEYRYLRRKRTVREKDSSLGDEAYNAILTTKAIASTLSRTGVRSLEAEALIRKAEEARAIGDTRAVMEHVGSAKDALMKEKMRQKKMGDMAKLPAAGESSPPGPSETTKEKLEKDVPKNYMQSKFVLASSGKAIEEGRANGRNMDEAMKLLALAEKAFDSKDYDSALRHGLQAKKAAEGESIEIPSKGMPTKAQPAATPKACASCGSSLKPGDTFCRKCGVEIGPATCPSCGTPPREGDSFCRKCGVTLA